MPKMIKYTLEYNERSRKWTLKNDKNKKLVKAYKTKAGATKGGALKRAVGRKGGSVKIQKENGRIQEVRSYPSR